MEGSQAYWLALAIALGYEYGIKQWWGRRDSKAPEAVRYVRYRLIHLVLLSATGPLLFSDLHFSTWLALSVGLVILGSLELFFRYLSLRIQSATDVRLYQLNYLVPLSIAFFTHLIDFAPRFEYDYRLVFLLVFLAHPANSFIRWALDRDEPLPEHLTAFPPFEMLTGDRLTLTSETAAAISRGRPDQESGDQRAKVGRRIGTLERWLIVFLVASGNASSVGLVITAKSIVRYPQLGDREFAEYYLFGTLLSVVLALGSGFIVLGGL
jgi:hypothetical protein